MKIRNFIRILHYSLYNVNDSQTYDLFACCLSCYLQHQRYHGLGQGWHILLSCGREATLMHTNAFVQHWSGTRHSTRDPIDASNENISLSILDGLPAFFVTVASGLRNLNLRNGSSSALLIGLQDFKYWKLQLSSSFVRRRNSSYDTCSWNLLPAKLWPASLPLCYLRVWRG